MNKNLVWFNKEGDYLNITYNQTTERYEGDLIFHENSSDTFKTIGLYLFENIPSFEYEAPGKLKLNKFQLFNEHGFNFVGNNYFTQSVTKIEAVNNDSDFFSKWIYGEDFEKKYPIGSQIVFNQQFLEFTNLNQTYTIISTKKGAVMIISNVDNKTFNNIFGSIAGLTSSYTNITISGVNTFGVYNYIDSSFNNKISSWSEPDFYLKYFSGKKLNFLNTKSNNKVVTVKNSQLLDRIYYKYFTDITTFTQSSSIIAELILKSDLPMVYSGSLDIQSDRILFGNLAPSILRPGVKFSISGSLLNQNFITIAPIAPFSNNIPDTFYATQSQVIYNNRVWQCIQSYTQSTTSSITPENLNYWTDNITYLPVVETLIPESISLGQVYLTTNRFYYTYGWTQSNQVTLASFADKYKSDFEVFNINLYYNTKNKSLNCDLIYPSKYAEVNFYKDVISSTSSIGSFQNKFENQISVQEVLTTELNRDFSERWNYNIVFTDIDDFGIKVIINGMLYQEEVKWVYTGLFPDIKRTIDRTLRSWLSKYYVRLFTLGIIAKLQYLGNGFSVYYNAINLTTQYPNVPIEFDVEVGTTADFHIQDSSVIFYDMGIYFEATINGNVFGLSASTMIVGSQSVYDIPTTLSNWVKEYKFILDDYGIYVNNVNNSLNFNTKSQKQVVNYTFRIGKSSLPGQIPFEVKKKYSGNLGSLVTSNSLVLQNDPNLLTSDVKSFLDAGFATGMVVSVNNSLYPWNNQQYNILYVDNNNINFSYQGPFWATDDPYCDSSPFTTIAFSLGFGATGCEPPPIPPTGSGEFDILEFQPSFSLQYKSKNTYNQELYSGTLYMVDLTYVQISENIYVLGDNLLSINASNGQINSTIGLSGTQSVCLRYNTFNNYLYALTTNQLYVVDPVIDTIIATMSLSIGTPYDCQINTKNGDVYVSYSNLPQIDVWNYNNIFVTSISLTDVSYSLTFNEFEGDMYIEQNNQIVSRIKGSTRTIISTYSIPGLTHSLIYEPSDSSIFAFGTLLSKINNGTVSTFSINSGNLFNFSTYDNLNNNIILSISSTSSTTLNAIDTTGTQSFSKISINYGPLVLNQFDGDIYMASRVTDKVVVIDSVTGQVKHTETFNSRILKLIYNPARNSIWGIKPATNQIIEVSVNLSSKILVEPNYSTASFYPQYGTLDPNYVKKNHIWIKTDSYIRYPRQNYTFDNSQVEYVYKWETDQVPEMFMYDFSGNQLDTSGDLSYTGEKPLPIVSLNRLPNKNPNLTNFSEYQQTIFNEIVYKLDYIDSETNLTFLPRPLELFIGYNSEEEGTTRSTLQLMERENISLCFIPTIANNNFITFTFTKGIDKNYGVISLDVNSDENFLFDINGNKTGLRVGQHIKLMISDITNTRNKFVSFNNAKTFKIREIYNRQIVVDFISDVIVNETNVISDYPRLGDTTFLKVIIKTVDKEIARFNVLGQTEIEDERYRIELSNTGHLISAEDIYIFKEYDINEQGIDWNYLNKKRKEMLLVRSNIYPYVGSYKAIINAINYFGYNDLQLYEYYRNVNPSSPDFQKLFKIEIPDIFDNSVEGWTENDFIKHTLPNANFSDTNLFNLTYRITDFEGNNLLFYSLREVLIKLQGLKYWLESNVIPITHKILDITGRADFMSVNTITHKSYDTKIINIKQNMSPVDFKVNESYLLPINSGSTVYNVVLDFIISTSSVIMPDYFDLTIRTYKTYKEWDPFTTYNLGDRVIYYQQLYESDINSNRLNNPRKYESITDWNMSVRYQPGEIVKYKNKIYQYIGLTYSPISITPVLDTDWLDITQWRKINYTPVQTIKEFRTGTQSFNFTVDSNLDPFITIEVTSDNGYGQIYTNKKNYELRSPRNFSDSVRIIEVDPLIRRI